MDITSPGTMEEKYKLSTHQLKDDINIDNETNGLWPKYDDACKKLIDVAIPRLLGAPQSEGREITPTLIHSNPWEQNFDIDMETGRLLSSTMGAPMPITNGMWNMEVHLGVSFRLTDLFATLSAPFPTPRARGRMG